MKKVKIFSLLLAMGMLLTACGGEKGGSDTTTSNDNKNAVFKEIPDLYPVEGEISQMIGVGDLIYVEQYVFNLDQPQAKEKMEAEVVVEENSEDVVEEATEGVEEVLPSNIRKITGFSVDGTVMSELEMVMDNNCGGGHFTVDSQGNFYTIMYRYATYEGDDTTDKIYLECYGPDGSQKWSIHLNENMGNDTYFYSSSIYCDEKDQIILDTSRGFEVYDGQGNPVKIIEKAAGEDRRLLRIRDGKFAIVTNNGSGTEIQTVDFQSGALGEKTKLDFNYFRYQIINGLYYDLYLSDDYGIYGYNIGDVELTKVMDFVASDFSGSYLYFPVFIDENNFVTYYYEDEGVQLSKFTKVAPEDVVDKQELTLGCYYLEYNAKERLVEFNKNSDKYRIYIKDYSMYDTMDDYEQGLTRLNADIVSGNVPDIMLLSSQMPIESYVSKGVFADLNEFLEKDTELKKEALLPNVLEALSTEDGLYRIAPSFTITTFVGKTADVGKEPGWTMDEAIALLKTKPEGTNLLSEITASNFVYFNMWICGEEYVDWEKGECYFDSDGFKKILEYANTLPREVDYSAITDDESYWQEMETQYRNGKTILSIQYLSSFRDYAYTKQGTFGEDITMIGFPVENGLGACLNINNTLAISATGKQQEAAWEFVKSFFTQESQEALGYELPVRIDSLRKLEEAAWEPAYTVDEQGNKHEYKDYFYVNGMEIEVVPLTKEETGEVVEYIKSINNISAYDEELYNIVTEETESYFSGQKSVEEVVNIIQSRAKIYINENL